MVLTLEVIGEQAEDLGADRRKVFHGIGGTIGRLPDNDWVFPDAYVSGRHALIRYLNGKYFIEDTSTNGVFINSPDQRLSRTQPQQLRHGDLLYIDAYHIKVSLESDPASPRRNDPFANLKPGSSKAKAPRNSPAAAPGEDGTATPVMRESEDHGTEWFGMSDMSQLPRSSVERARLEPIRPVASPPKAAPRRASPSAAPSASKDLRDHQAATLAAVRLAFEAMLAQFDPDRLQEEFDRQIKQGSILGVPAQLPYWDLYRDKYGATVKDAEKSFRTLFSDEFARAYEEQIERLRAANRGQ